MDAQRVQRVDVLKRSGFVLLVSLGLGGSIDAKTPRRAGETAWSGDLEERLSVKGLENAELFSTTEIVFDESQWFALNEYGFFYYGTFSQNRKKVELTLSDSGQEGLREWLAVVAYLSSEGQYYSIDLHRATVKAKMVQRRHRHPEILLRIKAQFTIYVDGEMRKGNYRAKGFLTFKRFPPQTYDGPDPFFGDQWHLENTAQYSSAVSGEDANVVAAWNAGRKGRGVRIAIVDDGLEIRHEDLHANVAPGASYNYINGSPDPTGGWHGTSCAGVAAAVGNNSRGVTGAAPAAELVGYNLLTYFTSANEVDALTRDASVVSISSNSWGAPDDANLSPASRLFNDAIEYGLTRGRNGLGTVYVWAGGNGRLVNDNSNYEGRTNHRGVIAVGAVNEKGIQTFYSEPGANLWIAAPSSSEYLGITTVDRTGRLGYDAGWIRGDDPDYTDNFGGTSAAAPLVAGVVALILEANPALSWRDVRLILAESARQNDPGHPDWIENGAGHLVNHSYGFGVVDAGASVDLAARWRPVGPELTLESSLSSPNVELADGGANAVEDFITVDGSGIRHIEYVMVEFSTDHPFLTDLEITLTSPSGAVSVLAEGTIPVSTYQTPVTKFHFSTVPLPRRARRWYVETHGRRSSDLGRRPVEIL